MRSNSQNEETAYLEHRSLLIEDSLGAQVVEVASILNGKTSALLTHVSIVIAVSTGFLIFLASKTSSSRITVAILILEVVVYLVLSLFCLMAITMSGWNEEGLSTEELVRKRAHHLRTRRKSYRVAISGTMIATVVLIVTILVELIQDLL